MTKIARHSKQIADLAKSKNQTTTAALLVANAFKLLDGTLGAGSKASPPKPVNESAKKNTAKSQSQKVAQTVDLTADQSEAVLGYLWGFSPNKKAMIEAFQAQEINTSGIVFGELTPQGPRTISCSDRASLDRIREDVRKRLGSFGGDIKVTSNPVPRSSAKKIKSPSLAVTPPFMRSSHAGLIAPLCKRVQTAHSTTFRSVKKTKYALNTWSCDQNFRRKG